jgi:hypothetical protein
MPTQSSNKHDLREFINLFQINCYFHGKGVDVFLITNLTPMSTIFSTLLNNILPDAGQFIHQGKCMSSQTLLMFHVIVDIFLKMEFSLHHLLMHGSILVVTIPPPRETPGLMQKL